MKSRLISLIVTVLLLTQSVSASGISYDDALETMAIIGTSAEAVLLYCCDNDETVYSENGDKKLPMASTTKIMTVVVALEHADIDKEIKVPKEACGVEGSSVYLYPDEKITMKDLLYAVMLESANDAATALAIAVGGDLSDFVKMMNAKAAEIGMLNSNFVNPHGLDHEQHYSTAYDMALLMDYAMENPVFAEITGTYKYTSPMGETARVFINHNRLLNTYNGVCGGKTGYTKRSGRCLVSVAERDGVRLCAVTLNDPDDWKDHAELYDAGFELYERLELDGAVYEIPVINGNSDTVTAVASPVSVVTKKGTADKIVTSVCHPRFCYAVINKDEVLGWVIYTVDGKELAVSEIKADHEVRSIKYKNFFEKIISFFIKD